MSDELATWNRRKRMRRGLYLILLGVFALGLVWWIERPQPALQTSEPLGLDRSDSHRKKEPSLKRPLQLTTSSQDDEDCDTICRSLESINEARRDGFTCPNGTYFESTDVLDWDEALAEVAIEQASFLSEMGYLDHHTPDSEVGATLIERLEHLEDVTRSGEVLYRGSEDGQKVMGWWLDSSRHCPILMDPSVKAIGLGFETDDGPFYWVGIVAD